MVWVRKDLKGHEQEHIPLDCVTQTAAEEFLVRDFTCVEEPVSLSALSPARSSQTMH